MARYKGTQVSRLYEKLMQTLCTINLQPLQAEASTILGWSLSHTYAHLPNIYDFVGYYTLLMAQHQS